MADYSKYNAANVSDRLNGYIDNVPAKGYRVEDVYEDLSIFDWFTSKLGKTKLKQMQSFLMEAIKLGYTGYVCFKVGASGCANGMWAHKAESTDGYSPDGECLYHSFTPDYTCWAVCDANENWTNNIETTSQLEYFIKEMEV